MMKTLGAGRRLPTGVMNSFQQSIRVYSIATQRSKVGMTRSQTAAPPAVLRQPVRARCFSSFSSGGKQKANSRQERDERNVQYAIYALSGVIGLLGLSYAAVPLYRVFCQATGFGGTTQTADMEKFKRMKPVEGARPITVYFSAETSDTMPWKFIPQQRAVRVVPGETALAFFRAHNPSNQPVTGVSTYNVTPMKAGVHFNKIQCFCFEEQRLRPKEEIDMPVRSHCVQILGYKA